MYCTITNDFDRAGLYTRSLVLSLVWLQVFGACAFGISSSFEQI
jgi:hypothetical protein